MRKTWNPELRGKDPDRIREPQTESQIATHFRKGVSGNPNPFGASNKDAAQARLNAKVSLRLRAKLLDNLESLVETEIVKILDPETSEEARLEARGRIQRFINSDINTMLRDVENRGLGAPKQEVSLGPTGPAESMTDDELEAIASGEITEVEDD